MIVKYAVKDQVNKTKDQDFYQASRNQFSVANNSQSDIY